jgi:hypothetical protein
MTIEEVRKRLAKILGDEDAVGTSGQESSVDNETQDAKDAIQAKPNNRNKLEIRKVEEYQSMFGGEIVNNYLMNNRQMTHEEYVSHSRGLKQEEMLSHPLMYAMFRADGQKEFNFFEWMSRFKK